MGLSQDLLKESELVFTEVWPQLANNAMGPPSLKPGWAQKAKTADYRNVNT